MGHGEDPTQEQVLLTGTVAHGESTLERVFLEELQPVERTHAGAGVKCEEEGVSERNCYVLCTDCNPPFPVTCALGEGGGCHPMLLGQARSFNDPW